MSMKSLPEVIAQDPSIIEAIQSNPKVMAALAVAQNPAALKKAMDADADVASIMKRIMEKMGTGQNGRKGKQEQGDCPLCLARLIDSVTPCRNQPDQRFCAICVANLQEKGVNVVEGFDSLQGVEKIWFEACRLCAQADRKKEDGDRGKESQDLYEEELSKCEETLKIQPGHANAQFRLANMYHNGLGVARNMEKAVEYMVEAATQGHAAAQCNLAGLFQQGEGVAQDGRAAAEWCEKSAKQGFALAQYNLSTMYAHGVGVMKDDAKAAVWMEKAAEQGSADAQGNMGYRYYSGEGVEQDTKRAIFWMRKAGDQGHTQSKNAVDLIMNTCHMCTQKSAKMMTCARCKFAKYCGKDCQRAHWKQGHKMQCKQWASEEAGQETITEEETEEAEAEAQ